MVFSSVVFIFCFLPLVYGINCLCGNRLSNVVLLIASVFFYAWGEPLYVILIIISIFINYLIGILIGNASSKKAKKGGLLVGVIFDLVVLGYYKYSGMLVDIFTHLLGRDHLISYNAVALPIGISFFTFQEISYLVDVYKNEATYSHNIIDVALYISFFPQLIAGPIVKYHDICEYLRNRSVTFAGTADGYKRFTYGLSKKVLIANELGTCVDKIYALNLTGITSLIAWVGAVAYTFQIYYDFSGYSDMAIGLGQMFGFTLPENFDYPYISHSITEFWRRWHITLGSWFRQYVYIPLGGSRRGNIRTYVNLIVVFCLTGLWHGANMSFALWGLLNGLFIIVERKWIGQGLSRHRWFSMVYCFIIEIFCWVLFRADSITYAVGFVGRMIFPWKNESGIRLEAFLNSKFVVVMILAVFGAGFFQSLIPSKVKKRWRGSVLEGIYCVVILIFSIASIASGTYNPFIYFQF